MKKIVTLLSITGVIALIAGCAVMKVLNYIIPTCICIGGLMLMLAAAEIEEMYT